MTPSRLCRWCGVPLAGRRSDALTCSKRCRQAFQRFTPKQAVALSSREPRRLAYADPPYPGLSRLYRDHPDYAGEVDHRELLSRLAGYDGWALSTSARALPVVLQLAPTGTRVAAWFRGPRFVRSQWPLSAWEPVLWSGEPSFRAGDERRVDSLVYQAGTRLTDPARVIGSKPAAFLYWLFELLDVGPHDTLDDLFPAGGRVSDAFRLYVARGREVSSVALAGERHDASEASCGDPDELDVDARQLTRRGDLATTLAGVALDAGRDVSREASHGR